MSRSSAANASRAAQQSSQRAAQQATRTSSMVSNRNSSKYKQDAHHSRSQQARSMMAPRRRYSSGAPYTSQYMATSYYNNWLYFYIIASQENQSKTSSVKYQMNMLKNQMKPHEKLYTVTIQTNKGKRVIVVPKKQYDKIKTGKNVKIKNGIVQ